ncbi:MAG: hypothetical protein ACLFV3_11125 [Phycisphaeraceae bacterium]
MVRTSQKPDQARELRLRRCLSDLGKARRQLPDLEPEEQQQAETLEENDVRQWLVDRVRQQIENDQYDEDARLDAILDRVADDLGVELTEDQPTRVPQKK